MTLTDPQMLAMLEALIDAGAPFDPAAVFTGVFTAIVNSGASTAQGDVTYATGAMATRNDIAAWGDPYKLADGRWAVDGPLQSFRPASAAQAQTLAGWSLSSAGVAGDLLAFGLIVPPISLEDEFSEWSIIVRLTLDPAGRWSAEITFNG